MTRQEQEIQAHERWLAEYTDRLRPRVEASQAASQSTTETHRCWQCDAVAAVELPVGSVRVRLCNPCAQEKLQALAVALWDKGGQSLG